MSSGLYVIVGGAALCAFIALVVFLLRDDKSGQLASAAGRDLRFPQGTFLKQEKAGSIFGAGASLTQIYGTDAGEDEILSFYDPALRRLGYERVEPQAPADTTGSRDRLVAEYRNGQFTYRIWLSPLPARVSGVTISSGYRHLLYTRLSN